jgi:hypothetical protein
MMGMIITMMAVHNGVHHLLVEIVSFIMVKHVMMEIEWMEMAVMQTVKKVKNKYGLQLQVETTHVEIMEIGIQDPL